MSINASIITRLYTKQHILQGLLRASPFL